MSSNQFTRAVRAYSAANGVSFTAARRALIEQQADDVAWEPIVFAYDRRTECWRSWSNVAVRWSFWPTIDGEPFDSRVGIVVGRKTALWLDRATAPVGSLHGRDQHCLVCHADHPYPPPTTLAQLEHRAHQARAAIERRLELEMGSGVDVVCEQPGNKLALTLRLVDGPQGLWGLREFVWTSDNGWFARGDTFTGRPFQERTELRPDTWIPDHIAGEFEDCILRFD